MLKEKVTRRGSFTHTRISKTDKEAKVKSEVKVNKIKAEAKACKACAKQPKGLTD